MSDTVLRHLAMLQLIPRRAPGITTERLQRELDERGFEIGRRSVQRDLNYLSDKFALLKDEGEQPRWRWADGAKGLNVPAHDAFSALTWTLIEEHIEPLLPLAVRREATAQFEGARNYLAQNPGAQFRRWKERVRVIPRAFALRTPEVADEVLEPVYQTLFEGMQLEISYQSRGSETARTWQTNPLGMVIREGVVYLVVTIEPFTDLRQIVAHRIRSAVVLDRPVKEPEGFDLGAYIESGAFSYVESGPVKLVIRVEPYAAEHILESPIAEDQTNRTLEDGRIEITASTVDTQQLRWWLKGFGAALEVIEPDNLRDTMAEQARDIAALYQS